MRDKCTDQPLDATIVFADGKKVVVTGGKADQEFEPGTYTVTVESDGYGPVEGTIDVKKGETATVDFALYKKIEKLDEIYFATASGQDPAEVVRDAGQRDRADQSGLRI
ncbi:MAG: PEGA domain-containing protein [Deltaproteobacteria bacterium]|nr:PEGA domain-containing protein [Deltaproteobacteria bacterium]